MRALLVALAVTALSVSPAAAERVPTTPDQKAILGKLAGEMMFQPEVPKDMPNPASWEGMYGRWTAGLSNVKTAREKGNPLAIFMVAERICPDTDEGFCYLSILLEFSVRTQDEQSRTDSVVRYTVLSDTGTWVSGYALNRDKVDTLWVRRDGAWLKHVQDSPEYVVTKKLLGILVKLTDETDMRLKESPPPPNGTSVKISTPLPGRRTFCIIVQVALHCGLEVLTCPFGVHRRGISVSIGLVSAVEK